MPNFKIGSTSFGFYFQFLRALSKFDAKTSCAATPGGGGVAAQLASFIQCLRGIEIRTYYG